ncbi:MAG: hypothetical protein IJP09_02095 [Clostridia bacterium]|nr:hypothetical protein [Clostridia bacterium]
MFKLYPIPEETKKCEHFSVKVNGNQVDIYSCLVSAIPFNTPWPGHERCISQAEEASFLYVDTDEILNFEIVPEKEFSDLKIRPISKNITTNVSGKNIKFSAGVGQYTVELDGHHNALHIFINPIKNYCVDINDKSVIYFGAGVHFPGTIELKSGQTLFVDSGAVVHASVRAEDCENVKVLGHGIIDYETFRRHDPLIWEYDGLMNFVRCKNIIIDGVILKDSAWWTVSAFNCENFLIDNVKVIGMWRYNTDGFDMVNSSHVIIRNCFLRTFDDSIVFKGLKIMENGKNRGYDLKNVEDHLVENCVIWCDWGRSLEIGAETCADEYVNICYKDCDLIHNDFAAMDIQNGDRADIHDVLYENIRVEYSKYWIEGKIQETEDSVYLPKNEPHLARLMFSEMNVGKWSQDLIYGHTRNVEFKNITVYLDEGLPLPVVEFGGGTENNLAENISVENLVINGVRYVNKEKANFKNHKFSKNITLK